MNHPLSDSKVGNVNKENWETEENRFIRADEENTEKNKVLMKRQEGKKIDINSEDFIGLLETVAKMKEKKFIWVWVLNRENPKWK